MIAFVRGVWDAMRGRLRGPGHGEAEEAVLVADALEIGVVQDICSV